jgi:hypothetical protein
MASKSKTAKKARGRYKSRKAKDRVISEHSRGQLAIQSGEIKAELDALKDKLKSIERKAR